MEEPDAAWNSLISGAAEQERVQPGRNRPIRARADSPPQDSDADPTWPAQVIPPVPSHPSSTEAYTQRRPSPSSYSASYSASQPRHPADRSPAAQPGYPTAR